MTRRAVLGAREAATVRATFSTRRNRARSPDAPTTAQNILRGVDGRLATAGPESALGARPPGRSEVPAGSGRTHSSGRGRTLTRAPSGSVERKAGTSTTSRSDAQRPGEEAPRYLAVCDGGEDGRVAPRNPHGHGSRR